MTDAGENIGVVTVTITADASEFMAAMGSAVPRIWLFKVRGARHLHMGELASAAGFDDLGDAGD